MAWGNWDEVITAYQAVINHPRAKVQAQGMLKLIPDLREETEFSDAIPITSHLILMLMLPKNRGCVAACWLSKYEIEVGYSNGKQNADITSVPAEQALETIKAYYQRLRSGYSPTFTEMPRM